MGNVTIRDILYLTTIALCVLGGRALPMSNSDVTANSRRRLHMRNIPGSNDEPCALQMSFGAAENTCVPNNIYRVVPPGMRCVFDTKINDCQLKCISNCNNTIKVFYRKQIELKKKRDKLKQLQKQQQQMERW